QITTDFSIMKIVLELRRQRPSAVQTKDQYQFIFTSVACMFKQALQPTSPQLYCNLSELKTKPEKPERKTSLISPHPSKRSSKQIEMNDTYAVSMLKLSQPWSLQQPGPLCCSPRPEPAGRCRPPTYDNDLIYPCLAQQLATMKQPQPG
ncbi:tyrosine-protein phosphatase non-receptor type 18-like isoform X1, partial [Lates japonicus]